MYSLIADGMCELGLEPEEAKIGQLVRYAELLCEWNEKINLTAITDTKGIVTKHFLDSLTPLLTGHIGKRVIDVGTGAGFPGMVLKIARPELQLTLLDSLNKRLGFLKTVSEELGLDGIDFVHARAEDGGRRLREKYDTVLSRAVANMTVLSELCLPFLKVGGSFLALKGPLAADELNDAARAIKILGGEVSEVFECNIPFTELKHKIIIVKKVRQTPMQYPRKAGIPSRLPIDNCYNLKKNAKNAR